MSYKAIRDALQTLISSNLTAITNTSYTLHNRIPENVLDAQGYSIIVAPNAGRFPGIKSTSQVEENQTWFVDLWSPNAGTGFRATQEDNLLDYATALKTVFTNKRDLDINGVMGMRLTDTRFNDGDYPINSNATKYHFRIILSIEFTNTRDC
jgi:hypothetical protein